MDEKTVFDILDQAPKTCPELKGFLDHHFDTQLLCLVERTQRHLEEAGLVKKGGKKETDRTEEMKNPHYKHGYESARLQIMSGNK